jgi:hypothetical protein
VRMDPFSLFAAYPTEALGASTRLIATGIASKVADLPGGLEDAIMVRANIPPLPQLDAMLTRITTAPVALIELLDAFPGEDRRRLVNGVAFLLKMGLIARA